MAQSSIKRNTLYNSIKTISAIVFPLITFPYVSRVLMPENIGKINFGASIVSYFSLFASLGIGTYAIRECAAVRDDQQKLSDVASQIFSINVVTTAISYVALFLTLMLYDKLANYRLLIEIQSLSIIAATLGADWLNSAMEDFRYITMRSISFQVVSLVLMFAFVHKPEDYMSYAIISLVSSAGANVVNIWYRRKYCKVRMIWDFVHDIEWKRHLAPIMYMFVMILSQVLFNNIDITMLGIIHGDVEVGLYSTAHKISNLVAQVIVSSVWVVMPRMSHYFANGDFDEINGLLRRILGFFALVGLPFIVGTICVSQEIILIIAGEEYLGATVVLQVIMVGYVFDLFGNSFIGNIVCLPLKRERLYAIVWLASAVLNIALNVLLIPRLGAFAAALTTSISYAASLVMLVLTLDKRVRICGITTVLVGPVLGCLGIACACAACNGIKGLLPRVVCKVGSSVIAYTSIQLLARNEFFIEMRNDILHMLRRSKKHA